MWLIKLLTWGLHTMQSGDVIDKSNPAYLNWCGGTASAINAPLLYAHGNIAKRTENQLKGAFSHQQRLEGRLKQLLYLPQKLLETMGVIPSPSSILGNPLVWTEHMFLMSEEDQY